MSKFVEFLISHRSIPTKVAFLFSSLLALHRFWSYRSRSFFFCLTVMSISAADRHSVHNSNNYEQFRCKDVHSKLFRQVRLGCNDDARVDSAFSSMRPQLAGTSGSAQATETNYIDKFQSFLAARQIVSMNQDSAKLDFSGAHFGARYNAALGAWGTRCLVFGSNGATFAGSSDTLDVPSFRYLDDVCLILTGLYRYFWLAESLCGHWTAILCFNFLCKSRPLGMGLRV